jgi:hypothetical protein
MEDCEYGRGENVARNTFLLQDGYERGLVQHFFTWEEISELLSGFRVFDVECHDERFPSSFGIDKSFVQSTTGFKGHIDSSNLNLDLRYSRWHIAAEKAVTNS